MAPGGMDPDHGAFIHGNRRRGRLNIVMAEDMVIEILRNALQLDESFALSDATRLDEIPNLDSLGQVQLVMEIERVLDDRLGMDEIIGMESVGDIRKLLVAKGKLLAQG
jgi:acyl carrier protein